MHKHSAKIQTWEESNEHSNIYLSTVYTDMALRLNVSTNWFWPPSSPTQKLFFHHHKQTLTAFFFTRVDKHKNASNKLLHFCPKKKRKRKRRQFSRIIHSKAIMLLINFQLQYVYVPSLKMFSYGLIRFPRIFWNDLYSICTYLASIECWRSMHWKDFAHDWTRERYEYFLQCWMNLFSHIASKIAILFVSSE